MVNLDSGAKKGLLFIAGVALILVVLAIFLVRQGDNYAKGKFKEELALAKSQKMIVDEEDLKRFNPRIPDTQNAALIYSQLETKQASGSKAYLLSPQPYMDANFLKDLLAEIKASEGNLRILEEASLKEKCWIDLAFGSEEKSTNFNFNRLSHTVDVLIARAVVSKMRGDVKAVLKDFRTIDRVAQHFLMTKDPYGYEYAESVTDKKSRFLAAWAGELPPGSIWHKELENLADDYFVPSRRDLVALDLYEDLQASKASETREQRSKVLGFMASEEQGVSPLDYSSRSARAVASSMIKVLRGRIKVWVECGKEEHADPRVIDEGNELISEGIRGHYWLQKWKGMRRERSSDNSSYRYQKLALQAAVRVLAQNDRSKVPSMAGLPLPASALPPRIGFLADSISISVYSTSSRRPEATFFIPLKAK